MFGSLPAKLRMIPRKTRPIRLALKTAQILAGNVGAEKANMQAKARISSVERWPGTTVIGTGKRAGEPAAGEICHERTRARGVLRGAKHEHADILVLLDQLGDLLRLSCLRARSPPVRASSKPIAFSLRPNRRNTAFAL